MPWWGGSRSTCASAVAGGWTRCFGSRRGSIPIWLAVRCEAAEWAVRWHTGYPPRDVDRHDVSRLCERFGHRVLHPGARV